VSGWHHVRIEAVGANLKVYWDGVLKFEVQDATFTSGQVGLLCSQAAARFDNVVVTGCEGLPALAPVLEAVGDRTAFVGQPVDIQLQATAPGGAPLQWSATGLPPGAVLGEATGRLLWTPDAGTAFTAFRTTLRASDGALDDAETVTWTVLDTSCACAYDGFDTPEAAGTWLPAGGTWTVAGGVYTGTSTAATWSRFGSSSRRDYTLQARIRVEGSGSGNLVFRAVDDTHYYYLYASGSAGELEIRKRAGDTTTTLARGGDIAGAVRNRWHTYRIEAIGNRIRVWADGDPRFEVIDADRPHLHGAVGLRVEGLQDLADRLARMLAGLARAKLLPTRRCRGS
jgi:hypothetical protein